MEEPREVTAPNGSKRWVIRNGRSFGSFEEAEAASTDDADDEPSSAPIEPEVSRTKFLISQLLMLAFFGSMSVGNLYYFWTGQVKPKSEWLWLILPVGWFLLTGLAIQSAAGVYAGLTGKHREFDQEAAMSWWMDKVGCGILIFIGGAIGLIVAWLVLSQAFEGISKGTGMIIILLFLILLALNRIASNRT